MATRPKKTAPQRRATRGKTKSFKLAIPVDVFERYEEVAARRGISVAALMIGETSKAIGLG